MSMKTDGSFIKGWNILSSNYDDAINVIQAADKYEINHLQLSHHIVMNLKDVKNDEKKYLANTLTKAAHDQGIKEVLLWDHALYDLDYYPDRFKLTGDQLKNEKGYQKQLLDLDNPDLWAWLQEDYRQMLTLVPNIDGLVLTFIETGARAEEQYSKKMQSKAEKLAKVVNKVTEVVVGEKNLNLYLRIFSYTRKEYNYITRSLELIEDQSLPVMMKEAPHDFFLTHPNSLYAGKIKRPTIIEFDTTGEFNGQGLIANTWPEYILERWSDYIEREHIIGYVARTDRYNDTRIVGKPSEINLYTLKRYTEDKSINSDEIYNEFITKKYNKNSLSYIKKAFKKARDIITSTLYTLGTNVANHSAMNFEPYASSYARHVSGKWLEVPEVFVEHGVERKFHYWQDVIDHIAPPHLKRKEYFQSEAPEVIENEWVHLEKELMNWEYYNYILTEKNYGVKQAERALNNIIKAQPYLKEDDYIDLFHYFNRTLLTVKLYKNTAQAYYGYRIYAQNESPNNPELLPRIWSGLNDLKQISKQIRNYPVKPGSGQWDWVSDARMAMDIYNKILQGWEEYKFKKVPQTFDY